MATAACNRNSEPLLGNQVNSSNTSTPAVIPVSDILDFLPETKKIIELVSNFFAPIHNDCDIPKFNDFFWQIICDNKPLFNTLTSQQKAQILFEQYRRMVVQLIEAKPEFQTHLNTLIEKWPEENHMSDLVRNTVENEISRRHSGLISFALVRFIPQHFPNVDSSDAWIECHNPSTVTHLLPQLSISPQIFALFHKIIAR